MNVWILKIWFIRRLGLELPRVVSDFICSPYSGWCSGALLQATKMPITSSNTAFVFLKINACMCSLCSLILNTAFAIIVENEKIVSTELERG